MKKMIVVILFVLMVLSGCKAAGNSNIAISSSIPDASPVFQDINPENDIIAVSVPASTERYLLKDGTEIFTSTYQHMELILPDENVADRVILNFLGRMDKGKESADLILTAAQADHGTYEPFYPYFYHQIYSPTRIDRSVLSLFGTRNSYNGGLHGNLNCVAANYDLRTGDVLTLGSIMSVSAEVEDFVQLILDDLARYVEDYYLYDDYESSVRNRLCSDENLFEDFYFTANGLCFFFTPYEIAPYSTGIITVELPYSDISHLLYNGYLPKTEPIAGGVMKTGSFMKTNMEQFSSMAEVTLTAGQEIMVAYPAGSVQDVRIHLEGDGMNIPNYTVFAAYEMSEENAVVISLTEEDMERITIEYFGGKKTQEIPLS